MAATETKTETLNRLFKENGLLKEDWFEHSQYRILTRSGIEKIQGKNSITVKFEAVSMAPNFCVVKAMASMTDKLTVETFGSAGFQADGNFPKGKAFQYLYLPEMAEKRALSRAVLKIMGLYSLGVFSEDESEDFAKNNQPSAAPKPVAAPSAPVSPSPAPSGGVAGSGEFEGHQSETPAPVQYATASQKEEIIRLLNHPVITRPEKTKMLLNINSLDEERAVQAIAKLRKAIEDREGGEKTAA